MPTVDIEENIKLTRESITKQSHEIAKLHGVLQTFEGFKKGGLKTIEFPNDPNQDVEELESIQEKPQ